jgi:hypothetical protein
MTYILSAIFGAASVIIVRYGFRIEGGAPFWILWAAINFPMMGFMWFIQFRYEKLKNLIEKQNLKIIL